ncbi:phage exclusion protein [Limnobaculum zhutongyuii]|uniref:Phage exclusion protein n=1 Tax=Limnobaculum zhutongyuii TaxID=2498113 RepID=A0A411WIC4_9GAMM|nr:phage exclusion protein Lit family protein [Limnobaculum zhutongyuii]QBH95930.1 phage exclusion protein [Limnobaculum zhutongyuii]TQS89361.1 phage exclusion protein [Limnobaculum zhutongyuii]
MNENQALEKLFEGVVPERFREVLDLVEKHSAQFRRIGDRSGFNLDAGAYGVIQFTQRSLAQMWIFGFACLDSLHCYSAVIELAWRYSLKFDLNVIEVLSEQKEKYDCFSRIIKSIEQLNNAESENDFDWPAVIPQPEEGKPENMEQAAVFDLVLMAGAYVFLHELKHVIFQSEGNAPEDPHEEEMACDFFASHMMLSKVDDYSITSGYPADKVRMKRSAGIALGNVFLAVVTPKHNLGGTITHPPIHQRWSVTLGEIDLEESDNYWLFFASLAIALIKYKEIDFPPQLVTSYKQLAISLIEALEKGI